MNGTARLTRAAGNFLRKLQTGVVQFYALVFAVGVTMLIYGLILSNQRIVIANGAKQSPEIASLRPPKIMAASARNDTIGNFKQS